MALLHRVNGIPVGSTQRIATRTTAGAVSSVRIKVGTDSAVSQNVVFSQPVAPNAQGDAIHTVSGLPTNVTRDFYYRVGMTSGGAETFDTGAVGHFRTAPSGGSFAFDFGSCNASTDSTAFSAIAARGDDLFFHLGDLYYHDGASTSIGNVRSSIATQLQASKAASMFSTMSCGYTPSDHEGMANDSFYAFNSTVWNNWNQAYREMWPYDPSLPSDRGVYWTFTWGRVRFIVLDDRSFKSSSTAADNSAKTALGATQKAWLKSTITAAAEEVVVIVQSGPWQGNVPDDPGDDGWSNYHTERNEIAAFMAASSKNFVMIAGDMHAMAAAGPSKTPGGIYLFHAAPFNKTSSQKGGPYDSGPYPSGPGVKVEQYGRVVVTDTGSSISLAFNGYTASTNTSHVNMTATFSVKPSGGVTGSGVARLGALGSLAFSATPPKLPGKAPLSASGGLSATATTASTHPLALGGAGALSQATPANPPPPPDTGDGPGILKVYSGTAWGTKPVKAAVGSTFVRKPLKRWDGTAWRITSS